MTKPFFVLAVVLAGLGSVASAQTFPTTAHTFSHFSLWEQPSRPRQILTLPAPEDLGTAPVSPWFYEFHGVDADTIALLVWASTRPETWGEASAPYQVANPGPSYVGLIPAPVPDGWVVTHRCLAWDDTYARAEAPNGDCYIHEMRPLAVGQVRIP